ncbi:MAG: EAL domain-containing protein [Eubacteriales bacterium]|nr:EAL domain-containing protein [Eubacteriales bacterium]
MKYIVVPEYISCVMLLMIGIYSLYNKTRRSLKETAFQASVVFAIAAILNNIISIYAIENAERFPVAINLYVNSFYFFSVAVMCAMVSITTYLTLLDARYQRSRLEIAVLVSMIFLCIETALVVINLKTKWMFYFDEGSRYHRGPLNWIGIAFLAIAIINVIVFYFINRKRVKKTLRFIVYMLPAIGVVLGTVQLFLPNTILTGTIIAFLLLTLFINSQQQRARVDSLTDISTREAFFTELTRLAGKSQPFHVILLRLRNLKAINTQYGQRAGDRILSEVASSLSQMDVRAQSFRVQGAEFAVIATKMEPDVYESYFSVLTQAFSEGWQLEGDEIELRALITDIYYPEHASGIDELIDSLEYAMRVAKLELSGRPVRFDCVLQERFRRRNYISTRMDTALREDGFYLNYQPVYNTEHQRFSGGEVLLRLNEENGRPIPPAEFIPIAIENGIATKLGKMVMEKTCRFLQEHSDLEIGWLSINVSSQQDEFDDTVRHLEMLLEKYQIDPCRIKLEITELVLLDDLDKAKKTMEELNKRGIGVYLDDFGTGYSNLVNVMTLPFQCVKIDKGFIRDITEDSKGYGMLHTVVTGLQSMQVSVLAEGVETPEQDNLVRNLGISLIQGYFYARPMLDDEFIWLLSQHKPLSARESCSFSAQE